MGAYVDCILDQTLLGEEYNPLKEIDKYGRQNPYQDPTRGRIDDIVVAEDTNGDFSFGQSHLL